MTVINELINASEDMREAALRFEVVAENFREFDNAYTTLNAAQQSHIRYAVVQWLEEERKK